MAHLFTFEGKGVYSPDGKVDVSPDEAKRLNAETSAAELEYWKSKPDVFAPAYYAFPCECSHSFEPKPSTPYVCNICGLGHGLSLKACERPRAYRQNFYPDLYRATVTTWNGAPLGVITHAHVYTHNFEARMVSLTVRGSNGAIYHGRTSWDSGNVITLHRSKRS